MALANTDELRFLSEEAEVQETWRAKPEVGCQPVGAHVLLKTTLCCLLTL